MKCALFLILLSVGQAAYPPPQIKECTVYFGDGTDAKDKLISVVDPDVPELFCGKGNAPCTFVHHSGPKSVCAPPTPPDKCHRYMKITYKKGGCDALETETAKGLAGTVDKDGVFDTSTGIRNGCKDGVEKREVVCWGPKKPISSKPPPNFPDDYDVEKCDCEKDLTAEYESFPRLTPSEHSGVVSVSSAGAVTLGFALFVAGGIAVAWRRRSFQDSHEEEGTELLESAEAAE